jgi:hypothetical protein
MSEEDPKRYQVPTVPPPPGEEDAYSASTVVGQASAELLALIRSEEDGKIASKPPAKPVKEAAVEPKVEASKVEASKVEPSAERVAPTGPPQKPVVVRSSDAPPAAPARPRTPAPRHVAHVAPESAEPGGGLHPALAIALVFAAVAGVLAALVR